MPSTERSASRWFSLFAVVSDCLHRAPFHGLLAKSFFFRSRGLFKNVGMSTVVVTSKFGRRRFTAQIAVDTLVVDVKLAYYVLCIFICNVCHRFLTLLCPIRSVFFHLSYRSKLANLSIASDTASREARSPERFANSRLPITDSQLIKAIVKDFDAPTRHAYSFRPFAIGCWFIRTIAPQWRATLRCT